MNKHTSWLLAEIRLWVDDEIIDQSTAETIKARYPLDSGRSWGFSLLTAIGAIIFGLGIILAFAYNWSEMPKFAKLGTIFSGIVITHGLALLTRLRKPEQHTLIEGLHMLGTMLFGAGIWLIAQIYNMDEHYPTAILVWGAGALLFAWAVPSVFQGIMATVLLTVWGGTEILQFDSLHIASIALIIIGTVPLAWSLRSRTLLLFTVISSSVLVTANIGARVDSMLVFYLLFTVSLLMIVSSYIAQFSRFPESASVLQTVGVIIHGGCLFSLTFFSRAVSKMWYFREPNHPLSHWILWGMLILALVVWLAFFIAGLAQKLKEPTPWSLSSQRALVLLSLITIILQHSVLAREYESLIALIFNIILALQCVLLIIRGTDNLQWIHVGVGTITLSILVYVRFGDLFHSLLMRSLAFLLFGALLFLVGHFYSKRKLQVNADA